MTKIVAISSFFAAFFIATLTGCNGPLDGNYRTIHLNGFGEENRSDDLISGGGGVLEDSTEIIEIQEKLKSKLDDLLKKLEGKADGESVSAEMEIDGSTCVVTLRKDGLGYNVAIGGVNLTNEHALKGLLSGMQEGLPDQKPIYLDFSDSGGEWMPSIISYSGEPEVDKTRFVSVTLPDTVTELYQAPTANSFVRTFDGFTNLEKVTARGITEISNNAFEGLANLKEVNAPNAASIGKEAFKNCSSLTTLTVDKEKIVVIKDKAFNNCQSLEKIDFPNVTTIESHAFEGCSSLVSTAEKPLFQNPGKIVSIGDRAFWECTSLEEVYFPQLITIPFGAFYGCTSLKSLKTDWALVATIEGEAFKDCKNLEVVNFSIATEIKGRAFEGCEKLVSADIPYVEYIDHSAFNGCKALPAVTFLSATSMGVGVFSGCTSLAWADLRNVESNSHTDGATFEGCKNLSVLILSKLNQITRYFFAATGTGDDGGGTGTATTLNLYLRDGEAIGLNGNYIFGGSDGHVKVEAYKTVNIHVPSASAASKYDDGWKSSFTNSYANITVNAAEYSDLPTHP